MCYSKNAPYLARQMKKPHFQQKPRETKTRYTCGLCNIQKYPNFIKNICVCMCECVLFWYFYYTVSSEYFRTLKRAFSPLYLDMFIYKWYIVKICIHTHRFSRSLTDSYNHSRYLCLNVLKRKRRWISYIRSKNKLFRVHIHFICYFLSQLSSFELVFASFFRVFVCVCVLERTHFECVYMCMHVMETNIKYK